MDQLVYERPGDPLPVSTEPPMVAAQNGTQPLPAVLQLTIRRLADHAGEHGLPAPKEWTDGRVGWSACCPAHDDRKPSLSVRLGEKHPVVVECHAGCTYDEVARALGINPRDFSNHVADVTTSLKLYGPDELAVKPPRLKALIHGIAACGTFGPFGGKEKTLKSHLAYGFAVAVAAGLPAFGHWHVPEARPVLIFAGEGGLDLTRRRLQRIAKDLYGIDDLSALPIYAVEGVADLSGPDFRAKLEEAAQRIGDVALLVLDSLYNYHPTDVEVRNLYARGGMLSTFQHMAHGVLGEQCTLWVVDHFRKSARGTTLEEYQQSGMGQWADSWFNIEHRQDPDLDDGQFWLNVTVGSRQGYAGLYEVDYRQGPFDEGLMAYTEPMRVTVRRVREHHKQSGDMSTNAIDAAITALANEGSYTKNEIKNRIAANHARVLARVDQQIADQQLKLAKVKRQEGNRRVTREVVKPRGKLHAGQGVPATRPDGG